MSDQSWDITDDASLKDAARGETQYDNGQVDQSELDTLLQSAKRVLSLRANVSSFYDDRGIAVALQGILMAKMKGAVENSPVQVKNLGTEDVTFRTSDGSSLQLAQYESMTQLGLSNAESTDAGTQNIEFTHTHYSDDSARIADESYPEPYAEEYYTE